MTPARFRILAAVVREWQEAVAAWEQAARALALASDAPDIKAAFLEAVTRRNAAVRALKAAELTEEPADA